MIKSILLTCRECIEEQYSHDLMAAADSVRIEKQIKDREEQEKAKIEAARAEKEATKSSSKPPSYKA